MADPKQKSLELPNYLTRVIPLWQTPQWMEAERWRGVVYNLPAAIDCRDVLINDLVAADWGVRPKDPKQEDALAGDIEYYTDVLNPDMGHAISGFDAWVEMGGQDLLTLPAGWNNEIVRWPDGYGPLSQPHPKGHVYKIAYMDGATVFPTFDREFPLAQRLKQNIVDVVYFGRNEVARTVGTPRPELERWGYGMAAPEKIYLALVLLFRGDQYYANLLLDTPEAGVLDLLDMSQKSATEWVSSFRTLMQGIDPFKIPVLYEHEKPAVWLPFGRPPTDMLFDQTYTKYAQLVSAGYGLTLTDIGLGQPQATLAGSIRDERRSRRSGFATTREKVRQMIKAEILPPYLEFVWMEKDEEARVQKGRAFVLAVQSLKLAKEAGFIDRKEGQAQLLEDGYFSIELAEPEEAPALPPAPPNLFGGNPAGNLAARVPASEGGEGDLTTRARDLPQGGTDAEPPRERISAVPKNSSTYDQMTVALREAFAEMLRNADRPRLLKLVKAATKALMPSKSKALSMLVAEEVGTWESVKEEWLEERAKFWFDQPSGFDAWPVFRQKADEILDELERLLEKDKWWTVPAIATDALSPVMRLGYSEGATEAARGAWELLYTEGLVDSPDYIGLNFSLSNPTTLAQLDMSAAALVRRVDDGTKYYLKRIVTSGVEEGLASPSIAQMIRDGAGADDVLKQAGFSEGVVRRVQEEIGAMADTRINSIVNTEIAKAETEGRIGQWSHMGLTRKAWVHTGATGPNDPCEICAANEALGFVPVDFMYDSVFGPGTVMGVPAHPGVDHCHVIFDENELMGKAGELEVWLGA